MAKWKEIPLGKVKDYFVTDEPKLGECPECHGEGKLEVTVEVDSFRDVDCDMCNGSGKVEVDEDENECNDNFPCDKCGDVINVEGGEPSHETEDDVYVCETCIGGDEDE